VIFGLGVNDRGCCGRGGAVRRSGSPRTTWQAEACAAGAWQVAVAGLLDLSTALAYRPPLGVERGVRSRARAHGGTCGDAAPVIVAIIVTAVVMVEVRVEAVRQEWVQMSGNGRWATQ
jgi:hypothetical protein